MTEVKIATIRGKEAKRIAKALDESGVLSYCRTRENGRKVLYVYTEQKKKKW
jgi:chromosome segregation and condensation protein ScpB